MAIGRDGRWALEPGGASRPRAQRPGSTSRRPRRCPIPTTDGVAGDARRGRRRPPAPARAVRRGRNRAGPARARGRPLRRRRRRGLGALHGQGPVQEGDARQRHPGRAARRAPPRRRRRQPVRLPGVREAGAPRLVGRDHEGARRVASSRPRSSSRGATTRRCSSRSSSRDGGRVRRARQPRAAADRVVARTHRHARARVVRLRVEVRRGRNGARHPAASCPRQRSSACSSCPWTRSSPASARGWRASTSSSARTARSSSTS